MVDRFAMNWRSARLDDATVALLDYTEKLTRSPASVGVEEVEALRDAGWDDRGITDAIQVCSYFNYINRIAEGLGVDDETWIDEYGRAQ